MELKLVSIATGRKGGDGDAYGTVTLALNLPALRLIASVAVDEVLGESFCCRGSR